MPVLSVVLVERRDEPLMSATDASVSCQRFTELELRRTEDPSTEARNRALDSVTADYVWFVESGDVLLPQSLIRAHERLETTAPDVLLVHHAAIDARGRVRDGPHRAVLQAMTDAEPCRLAPQPNLAEIARGISNKVLRTDHVRALGARFAAGHFGELGVTWPALAAADRIAAMPEPAYVCHQSAKPPGSPFDVFDAYDAALSAVPPDRRALVLRAMVADQLTTLRRLPEGQAREFVRRSSESLARQRTGDEPLTDLALDRVRLALVERDAYSALRLLERGLGAGRTFRARRRRRVAARANAESAERRAALQRHYQARLREPVDSCLAVYGAYWFSTYACNPRAIYEKARELVPHVRGVWVVKAAAAARMPPGVEYVVAGSPEYYDVIGRAGYLINNVGFPHEVVVREEAVFVQTHHGTPLKHMGLDQETAVAGARIDPGTLRRRVALWDYSVSANPYSTRIWERAYPGDYETLEVGYPRNDALVAATDVDVRRIRAELGIEPGQTAVLYAPTHREYQPGYVPVLDVPRVAEALGPDYVLLARPHYFYDADPLAHELHGAGRIRDVASHPSIEEVCVAADVLLTDYSSIMFDYAVLDRPIVIHAPDWEVYRAMRGTYLDLATTRPGQVTRSDSDLIEALSSGAAWSLEAARDRAAFRERFCSLEDGRAAERVVRRLWLSERQRPSGRVASEAR